MKLNEPANRRRSCGSTRDRGSSSSYATGDNRPRGRISEEIQTATDRPQMRDRYRTQIRLRDVIPQAGVNRIKKGIVPATRTGGQ